MKRLGLLGGTFDPIHCGHLVIAEEARVRLGLAEVRFIPAGQPPHKSGQPVTAAVDRLAMVSLATAANSAFTVSALEIERDGPSYTADTLAHVQQVEGSDCALYFIVGGDALPDLLDWHAPARILALSTLVAVRRPGVAPADLRLLKDRLPALEERLIILDGPQFAVSGTEIRHRIRTGLPIRYQVPEPVWQYVQDHRLYRNGE